MTQIQFIQIIVLIIYHHTEKIDIPTLNSNDNYSISEVLNFNS